MKFVFVGAFDAQFADQSRAGIGCRVDVLEILFADGGDVAERMHGHVAEWIMPRQAGANVHAGEFVAMHREARHFLIVELQLDRHAFVDVMRQDGALDAADILGFEQPDGDQARQGGVDFRDAAHLFAHQLDLKRR